MNKENCGERKGGGKNGEKENVWMPKVFAILEIKLHIFLVTCK